MDTLSINPTQAVGLCAFVAAAALTAMAARSQRGRDRQVWAVLTLMHALFLIEVMTGTRHVWQGIVHDQLLRAGLHDGRRGLQAMLLLILATVVAVVFAWVRNTPLYAWVFRARARTAAAATAGIALLFAVELISLHQIDAMLYARVGAVLVIGWLWAAGAVVTGTSACLTFHRMRDRHDSVDAD